MRYALNLDADGRILSSTFEEYAGLDQPLVDELPEGDLYEYRYIDGEMIYDPLPGPEELEHKPTMYDRVAALEEALDLILSGATE